MVSETIFIGISEKGTQMASNIGDVPMDASSERGALKQKPQTRHMYPNVEGLLINFTSTAFSQNRADLGHPVINVTKIRDLQLQISGCDLCPKHKALCDGTALAPRDHYWHNGSHSHILLRCLNKKGCKYPNRTSILMSKALASAHLELAWNNGYPLCQKVRHIFQRPNQFLVHLIWCRIKLKRNMQQD